MKVLFIARRFPPSVGGMERFAYDLSNALDNQVELVKITWGGSNKWLPVILPWFFFRACWELITHRDIEVIHMQDAVQAPIGWLLHVLFRKPYIVVAHGLDITYDNAFYQRVVLPFVRRADKVVSISTATNNEVTKRGVASSKTQVVTLGTHDDYGTVKPNRKRLSKELGEDLNGRVLLLTTGRLVKRKGVAWFIGNVLPQLVKKYDNILYLVAGDGGEREVIEGEVTKAELTNHVRLLGRVSDEVRSLLYQSSDIFVMPNIIVPGDMEGFGIVVHEAATAKLPVVASNLEGIADALHHEKNGVLVESKDAKMFIRQIEKFVKNAPLREDFGAQARDFTLAQYNWLRIADQYVGVYKGVIGSNGK